MQLPWGGLASGNRAYLMCSIEKGEAGALGVQETTGILGVLGLLSQKHALPPS